MTNEQLIEALQARKMAIEAAMLQTKIGSPAHKACWAAFQKASARYWRAAVWLHSATNRSIEGACA